MPWINLLGPIVSLEPAELMKLAFVLVLGRYLRFRSNYRRFSGLVAPFALALVPMVLILKQPDLGMAMLFPAGAVRDAVRRRGADQSPAVDRRHRGGPRAGDVVLGGDRTCRCCATSRRSSRSTRSSGSIRFSMSDNPAERQAKAYQTYRAMVAYASGGWAGKGFGNIPIGQSVPEAHNDMILALIGEQFGFFGIGGAAGRVHGSLRGRNRNRRRHARALRPARRGGRRRGAGDPDIHQPVGRIGLMPVTGITLPFVSYGGSSLVASFMAVGLLLNVGQNRPLVMARESFQFS